MKKKRNELLLKSINLIEEQLIFVREQKLREKGISEHPLNRRNLCENNLKWTGTKIEFVELVYSLFDAKSINNGNINLKGLFHALGDFFELEITGYYRYFTDITHRTGERTLYLDKLKKIFMQHLSLSDIRR